MTDRPTKPKYEAYIGTKRYAGPNSWLHDTYSWRLVKGDGALLADGEGCASRRAAVEKAMKCAREEFGLHV